MPCIAALVVVFTVSKLLAAPGDYFAIQVVDEQTNRGVPLVQLETTNNRQYFTDSAGLVAFNEPGLMNRKVFFTVTSPGYEYPADAFGYHGIALDVKPGGSAQIKIKRINIAERLYRVTGQGIYRDSFLLGKKAPIEQPLLDSDVLGQDSVQATIYGNRIYWFWGDTNRSEYPLGNFSTTGATSPQIQYRVQDETMDSATVGIPKGQPGYYYLEHVMYTQYFKADGYAVHGNWWTDPWNYGGFTSNGCVGLMNSDALWFWNFLSVGSTVQIHT